MYFHCFSLFNLFLSFLSLIEKFVKSVDAAVIIIRQSPVFFKKAGGNYQPKPPANKKTQMIRSSNIKSAAFRLRNLSLVINRFFVYPALGIYRILLLNWFQNASTMRITAVCQSHKNNSVYSSCLVRNRHPCSL